MKHPNTRKGGSRSQHGAPCRHTSHFLLPQICVLYLPATREYLVDFAPGKISATDAPDLARRYEEDEASTAALAFLAVTGKFVKVRPYIERAGASMLAPAGGA